MSWCNPSVAKVWQEDTRKNPLFLAHCQVIAKKTVWSVAVSPDGRHVVTASADGITAAWDLATGELLREFPYRRQLRCVAVSPDGRHVVTASTDGITAVWDLTAGGQLRELTGHWKEERCVAVSPDGRHVVTGSADGATAVWDLATGQQLTRVSLDGPVGCVGWAPDGRSLVAGDYVGNLYCLAYRER